MLAADITTNLDGLAAVFTQLMTWIGSLVTTIASNPLLLVSLGIFVAGAVNLLPHVKNRSVSVKPKAYAMAIPRAI